METFFGVSTDHLDLHGIRHVAVCSIRPYRLVEWGELDVGASLVSSLVGDQSAARNLSDMSDGVDVPRTWGQGKVRCVVSRPLDGILVLSLIDVPHVSRSLDIARTIDGLWKESFCEDW